MVDEYARHGFPAPDHDMHRPVGAFEREEDGVRHEGRLILQRLPAGGAGLSSVPLRSLGHRGSGGYIDPQACLPVDNSRANTDDGSPRKRDVSGQGVNVNQHVIPVELAVHRRQVLRCDFVRVGRLAGKGTICRARQTR